jgi:hypothetical protein
MKTKVLDFYYKYPLIIDTVILTLLYNLNANISLIKLEIDRDSLISIISSLIDNCVSLSGFILASLTIIVTFKASLHAKKVEDSNNELELFFLSGENYKKVITVFKGAIFELTLLFILLYFVWNMNSVLDTTQLNSFTLASITILAITIVRSLYLLFTILNFKEKNTGQYE